MQEYTESDSADLIREQCVSCSQTTPALTESALLALLPFIPQWQSVKDGKELYRRLQCKDFATALDFVNKVGALVESEQHHPDIGLGWGYAELRLSTHSINGLHRNDFIVAAKIDAIAKDNKGLI